MRQKPRAQAYFGICICRHLKNVVWQLFPKLGGCDDGKTGMGSGFFGSGGNTPPTEGLFNSLKNKRVHGTRYDKHDSAATDLFDYIEPFYNHRCRFSRLGGASPVKFLIDWSRSQHEQEFAAGSSLSRRTKINDCPCLIQSAASLYAYC